MIIFYKKFELLFKKLNNKMKFIFRKYKKIKAKRKTLNIPNEIVYLFSLCSCLFKTILNFKFDLN